MQAFLEIKTDEKERENRFNCHLLKYDKKVHVCSLFAYESSKRSRFSESGHSALPRRHSSAREISGY